MADRALLHLSKLDAFAEWMARDGWTREPTKGAYEVLRLTKPGEVPLVFYSRERAREHATVQSGSQYGYVRRFIRASRTARQEPAA